MKRVRSLWLALSLAALGLVSAGTVLAAPPTTGPSTGALPPTPSVDGCTFYRGVTTCVSTSTFQTVDVETRESSETIWSDPQTSTSEETVSVGYSWFGDGKGNCDPGTSKRREGFVTVTTTTTTQAYVVILTVESRTVTTDWLSTHTLVHRGAPISNGRVLSDTTTNVITSQTDTGWVVVSQTESEAGVAVLGVTSTSSTTTWGGWTSACFPIPA